MPALTEHSSDYDAMLVDRAASDSRARPGAAGRAAGGHRGRSLRHAGHYQPPQDRSSIGHAAHLPRDGHVVRRAPGRLRVRGLPLDRPPRRRSRSAALVEAGTADDPDRHAARAAAPAARRRRAPAGRGRCTPTSTPTIPTASTTCASSRCGSGEALPVYGPPETLERLRTGLPLHLRRQRAGLRRHLQAEPGAACAGGGPPGRGRGRRRAAACVRARPHPRVRIPDRCARVHHRRQVDPRAATPAAARARRAGAQRALVAAAPDPPQHRRGGRRPPRTLGARRTYLTHLTHETGHAELAAQLPDGIVPAYDGLTVEVS